MYLTIPQKDLARAFSLVSPIVGNGQSQMPMLKYVLLRTEPDGLAILAANEDTRICARVPATIQASDALLIPARTFSRFVGDLPMSAVTLMFPSPTDQNALHLRCQHIKANFKQGALSTEEFPLVQSLEEGEEFFTLDCELLKEIVEQVAFAAATNAARPALEGVRIACSEGVATFMAADTFRLAIRTIPIPNQQLTADVLIPASVLRTVARLLPSSGAVHLGHSRDGRQLLVQTREMDLSSRLLEGTFPNTDPLLRLEAPTRVVLPTQDLVSSVHLMSAFARENNQLLRCTVEASALLLEAEAPDLGANEMRLTEGVTVNGPTLSILINHSYMAEALATVPTQQVSLEMLDARRPMTIKPVGPLDARHIIMPLRLETIPTHTQAAPEATATNAAQ
jgi:DNA polymerase-3 subunit beta